MSLSIVFYPGGRIVHATEIVISNDTFIGAYRYMPEDGYYRWRVCTLIQQKPYPEFEHYWKTLEEHEVPEEFRAYVLLIE